MNRTLAAYIDKIIWHSAPRAIGGYQWRAVTYSLPERYGKGLTRSGYQFRRTSQFGSAPEQWADAKDFPGYARYRPNYGLPRQLSQLWDETGDLIPDEMDEASTVDTASALSTTLKTVPSASGQLGFHF